MIESIRTAPDNETTGDLTVVLIDFNKEKDQYMVLTEAETMATSSTQHI